MNKIEELRSIIDLRENTGRPKQLTDEDWLQLGLMAVNRAEDENAIRFSGIQFQVNGKILTVTMQQKPKPFLEVTKIEESDATTRTQIDQKPDQFSSVEAIKAYLKANNIAFKSRAKKAELLALIP